LERGKELVPGEPSEEDLKWVHMGINLPIRGRQFRDAYKFQAGDDWLRNLSLVLGNRTSKNIVLVSPSLHFPETKPNGPEVTCDLVFGRIPENVAYTSSGEKIPQGSNTPIMLAPGQRMMFSLAEDSSNIRDTVERFQPFSTVSLCYIHFSVYFEDGMRWSEGTYVAPDPAHAGKFIGMGLFYFPGPAHRLPDE
jgi:hypothetical protein